MKSFRTQIIFAAFLGPMFALGGYIGYDQWEKRQLRDYYQKREMFLLTHDPKVRFEFRSMNDRKGARENLSKAAEDAAMPGPSAVEATDTRQP